MLRSCCYPKPGKISHSNGYEEMIVVTEASKGLGREICERPLSRGIDAFGIARNVSELDFSSINCDVSSY